jgi:hypothetical protein
MILAKTRPISIYTVIAMALLLGIANQCHAESLLENSRTTAVDTGRVRKLYMDGEFEQAIAILDTCLKAKRAYSHADSVFIFKHLGVMHAARYETRERGKMYMHALLMVEPTARILDMYASDMIYMIFKNIQEEFEANRFRRDHASNISQGNGQSEPIRSTNRDEQPLKQFSEKPNSHILAWVGVGTILVATGAITYFLLSQPIKKSTPPPSFE